MTWELGGIKPVVLSDEGENSTSENKYKVPKGVLSTPN